MSDERETVCGNCRNLLYQNANPNNIHWFHVGTGDVRCPTTFAQPVSRASVVDDRVSTRREIMRRIALARGEKETAEKSGYDRDALRLDGAVGILENLLEDLDIAASSPVSPSPTPEQKRRDAVRLAEAVMEVFGNPGISPQTWDRLVEVCAAAPPSTQPSARVAAEESPRWCNNCGSKDIITVREFATAEQFLDAYNAAAGEQKE